MTETINFQDFMKQDYKKVRKVDYKVLSLSPFVINPSSWFHLSPLVAKGYMIVIGVGMVFIIAAVLEMIASTSGHTGIASAILDFFKFVMPLAFIAALVLFVMLNPLL